MHKAMMNQKSILEKVTTVLLETMLPPACNPQLDWSQTQHLAALLNEHKGDHSVRPDAAIGRKPALQRHSR